jgi:hypothetical protein
VADEAWTEHYYGQQPGHPHPTCIETTTYDDRVAGKRTYVCGPDCPKPAGPDPARDARVDAYRDRERRRAARALDRYIEVIFEVTDPHGVPTSTVNALTVMTASERFVEQVGDYVLARLGERAGEVPPRMAMDAPRGSTHAFTPYDPGAPESGTCMLCGIRWSEHEHGA